jgi:hypothetical protein
MAVPYTDLEWDPLLTCADRIISEGGIVLSQSTVVARE